MASYKQSRTLLKKVYAWYRKNWKLLPKDELEQVEASMEQVSDALLQAPMPNVSTAVEELQRFADRHMRKKAWSSLKELLNAIIFALIVATIIRQCWFELYEIPTGSMRPTFQEKDRLIVSKTDFGINVPLTPKHLYFDEKLVHHGGIITFTAENMDVQDPDQVYFYLFPGKKRLIKRMVGKPGDTLYFYGGKVYGYDKDGQEIKTFVDHVKVPSNLRHVPFMSYTGKISPSNPSSQGYYQNLLFKQMNQDFGRIEIKNSGSLDGQVLVKDEWVDDAGPLAQEKGLFSYGTMWGIQNYATTRILSQKDLRNLYGQQAVQEYGKSSYYLEISHTPSLFAPLLKRNFSASKQRFPMLTTLSTFLPLTEENLKTIQESLYTSRFVVQSGKAQRYSIAKANYQPSELPSLPSVPDGTYEFENGQAYEITFEGLRKALPSSHPLMRYSASQVQLFFNLGIDFHNYYVPRADIHIFPSRFAYYDQGDLFVMNHPLLKKDSAELDTFTHNEIMRQSKSSTSSPYRAFVDPGAPLLKDGSLDKDLIKKYGLQVPEKSYLVLGDNYASSADSRDFGFVPESNLRGGASFLLWPSGSRWGTTIQPPYIVFNTARLTIWSLVLLILIGLWANHQSNKQKPIFKRLSRE